jgi:hypothetical protein
MLSPSSELKMKTAHFSETLASTGEFGAKTQKCVIIINMDVVAMELHYTCNFAQPIQIQKLMS